MKKRIVKRYENGILVTMIIEGEIITQKDWPTILLPFKNLAKPGDEGAGDIIARIIGPIGGDAFKKWYKTLFGKDCGCGHRQDVLNARWPL